MYSKNLSVTINNRLQKHLHKNYKLKNEEVERQDVDAKKKPNQQAYFKCTYKGATLGWFLAWVEDGELKTEFRI